MAPSTQPLQSSPNSAWVRPALLAVLLLAAFLRFYELGASGFGNLYYAAAVKSMLVSTHNLIFSAYEPGGSVSLDKPPLGFWTQTASAALLGVNGFALALPQALSGLLCVGLVYALVRRHFSAPAALLAALCLALTPAAISAERNNTIDAQLLLVLLLAAWAFLRAAEGGRSGWLYLGALLLGVGFNIKMLQAYLPLPAFFLVYLFGVSTPILKRLLHLAAAGLLTLAVSFLWVALVDLTPPASRPYVGGSTNNSAPT